MLLLWGSLSQVVAGMADPSCGQDMLAGASMAGRVHQAAGPGLLHLLCDLMAARPDASYGALQAPLLPLVLRAHGPRAAPARAALSELWPGVPAEQALESSPPGSASRRTTTTPASVPASPRSPMRWAVILPCRRAGSSRTPSASCASC